MVRRTDHVGCTALRVNGSGSVATRARTFLLPFDRPRPLGLPETIVPERPRRWLHHLRHLYGAAHPFGGMRTAAQARIHLMPFQLEPALAMLRHGRLRVLIADEVGLGKTIQAGLMLSELSGTISEFRGLVLTPAGVREQWQAELRTRFSLQTTLADTAWLAAQTRELPPRVNPWNLPGIYVASLDLVKRPEVLRGLEHVTWDLIVVDEVHGAGPGTDRLAAAQSIGARSRRVVLLTATPPDDEPPHFAAMASIGALGGEDRLTVFRRTRRDAGVTPARRTVLLPVRLSAAERRMHRLLDAYSAQVWKEATSRRDRGATLAVIVLRKRALSSARSLAVSIRRRLLLLGTGPEISERQMLLPLSDEDPLPDAAPDEAMSAPGLADPGRERALLEQIASAADAAARVESKVSFLRRYLSRVCEPVLVFTEYRDTLAQLAAATAPLRVPLLLHGEMTAAERADVQREFNASGTLLLATDAASEGLNLHDRCRTVVHFELPWMPMRLEQRTGRVDRLGQTQTVHEVLLVARHTCERLVLAPLVRRARTAAAAGARRTFLSLTESTVAAAVLQGTPMPDVPRVPFHVGDDVAGPGEARAEADRLRQVRTICPRSCRPALPHRSGVMVSVGRRRSENLLVVVRLVVEHGDGQVVHQSIVPVEVDVALRRQPRTRRDARELVRELLRSHSDILQASVTQPCGESAVAEAQVRALMAGLARRETAIADQPSTAVRLVQAGLFDGRALAEARSRAEAMTSLLADRESRLSSTGAAPLRSSIQVAAVYIGAPRT